MKNERQFMFEIFRLAIFELQSFISNSEGVSPKNLKAKLKFISLILGKINWYWNIWKLEVLIKQLVDFPVYKISLNESDEKINKIAKGLDDILDFMKKNKNASN